MRFRVIDIETSGGSPSEIIEIAAVDVVSRLGSWTAERPRIQRYKPLGEISFHAMAIHHLTPADLAEAPLCTNAALAAFLDEVSSADILVAHNAAFEARHIPADVSGARPWLCTVKAARCAWPDAPGYEQALYAYTQNPESRSVYKTSLEQAIELGQKRNAVAPGLHAELGYLYLEEGERAAALQHFQQERALFPESARFMDRVINQIEPSQAVAGGQN
ncbi:DUF4810 domain-containing protein [Brevundimonas sp. NPDC046655]|uniref:DUF4810 domain-containing protein n=1 Tax=unclassified Brevundimonas TaxID=2622653 RepID=UPI00384B2D9D